MWSRQMRNFTLVLFILTGLVVVGCSPSNNSSADEAENQRVRTLMNTQAEAIAKAKEKPVVAETPDLAQAEAIERTIATNIGSRVSEPVDEILVISDDSIRYINKLPRVKKLTRVEFLFKANEFLALSDEEPIARQKFKKNKSGKYRFRDAANAVKTVAAAASKL